MLGTKLKKERQIDFQRVLTALQQLRELFSHLLDRRARKQLRYLSHKYYEYGNKCGKMLARALQKRRIASHICTLQSPGGEATLHSSGIASLFWDYYTELYNLDKIVSPTEQTSKLRAISDYLASAGLPSLMSKQQLDLQPPITSH